MDYFTNLLFQKELRAIDVIVISVISSVIATVIISFSRTLIELLKKLINNINFVIKEYYRKYIKHKGSLNELIKIQEKEVNGEKLKRYEKKMLERYFSDYHKDESPQKKLKYLQTLDKYLNKKKKKRI